MNNPQYKLDIRSLQGRGDKQDTNLRLTLSSPHKKLPLNMMINRSGKRVTESVGPLGQAKFAANMLTVPSLPATSLGISFWDRRDIVQGLLMLKPTRYPVSPNLEFRAVLPKAEHVHVRSGAIYYYRIYLSRWQIRRLRTCGRSITTRVDNGDTSGGCRYASAIHEGRMVCLSTIKKNMYRQLTDHNAAYGLQDSAELSR